jgi:hypothetical protein
MRGQPVCIRCRLAVPKPDTLLCPGCSITAREKATLAERIQASVEAEAERGMRELERWLAAR